MTDRVVPGRLPRVSPWPPDALAYALAVAVGAVLLLRRRWPLLVLVASVATVQAYHVLNYPAIGTALLVVSTRSGWRHRRWMPGRSTS